MGKRYHALDALRGITLISMILYHTCWDLVWIFGHDWPWFHGAVAYWWQQSICWTFILLSGFCQPFGKRKLRRAAMVFGSGVLITAVTVLLMPSNRVVFGVLTLIGSCMGIWILLEKPLEKVPALPGLLASLLLFVVCRDVNRGMLGFEGQFRLARLPEGLYRGWFMTWLGFPDPEFYSVDYFSLFPWVFLYAAGYFCNRALSRTVGLDWLDRPRIGGLEWIGRRSLLLYLLHQPAVYVLLWALQQIQACVSEVLC